MFKLFLCIGIKLIVIYVKVNKKTRKILNSIVAGSI